MKKIKESLEEIDIDKIKDFLIKKYKVSTWEECIDVQEFGDCNKICKLIVKKFPNTFDSLYDCSVDYSKIAIEKLNDLGDDGEMYGNHYLLSRKRTLYDFAKGTNTISGIYLLTQYDDMKDKYKIKLSSNEKKCIKEKIKRYL